MPVVGIYTEKELHSLLMISVPKNFLHEEFLELAGMINYSIQNSTAACSILCMHAILAYQAHSAMPINDVQAYDTVYMHTLYNLLKCDDIDQCCV